MKTFRHWLALSAALVILMSSACDNAARVSPSTKPGIVIRPLSTSLQEGDTAQLQVEVTNSASATAIGTDYIWSSSDPTLIPISPTGMVLAILPGTVVITAHSATANQTATLKLVVQPASSVPRVSIMSSSSSDSFNLGARIHLSADVYNAKGALLPSSPLYWTSSDLSAATVSQSGDVTTLQTGQVAIQARWGNGVASRRITIVPTGAINVIGGLRALRIGETATLEFVAAPIGGAVTPVVIADWSSDNASVISVSQTGLVTAIGAGEATISARGGAISASIRLVATRPIPGLGVFAFIRTRGIDSHLEIMTETGTTILSLLPSLPLLQGFGANFLGPLPRASFSPDRQIVAYDCPQGVCALHTTTGAAFQFNLSSDRQPSWSRDGQTLVMMHQYASIDLHNLRDMSTNNRGAVRYVNNPVLAPNGRDVLYQCDYTNPYDELSDICRSDSNGTSMLYKRDATAMSFSPVDSTLAYIRATGTRRWLVIEPYQTTASPDAPLVGGIAGYDDVSETAWSPDGTRLALVRMGELWIVDMPGAKNPVHVPNALGTFISSISWR